MKEKLTNNFSLKVLSLVLAVLLWILILSIEDPTTTKDFSDIPVTEVNGDQITEAGKAYSYTDGDTVRVRVEGRSSIVNSLTKEDFLAVADLSTISITGAVAVDVSCPKYPSLAVSAIGTSTVIKVDIEDMSEKALNVRVITEGRVASGKFIGTGVATPNLVTVSGPASLVRSVKEAVVYVSVNEYTVTDIRTNATLTLLDGDGNELTASTLNISESSIEVQVPIYNTKTVPIDFEVEGDVAEGYTLVSAAFEPKEAELAGDSQALAQIDVLNLTNYDLSGKNASLEDSMAISGLVADSLPEGVVLANPDAMIAIAVTIEPVREQSFDFPISKVQVENGSKDLTYSLTSDSLTRSLSVPVSGAESLVNALTADDIQVVVDVGGYSDGEYELPAEITLPDGLTLQEDVFVDVTVSGGDDEE